MPASRSRPTSKWVVTWSVVAAVCLALPLLAVRLGEVKPSMPVFVIGVMGLFVVGMVAADRTGPWTRYLPVAVPMAVVGLWPLYRVIALDDRRFGEIFLYIGGFFIVLVLVGFVHTLMKERRLVVDSHARRRLSFVLIVALALKNLLHIDLPSAWGVVLVIVLFATLFWPSRKAVRSAALSSKF